MAYNIVIVGGGITGLTVAYRLGVLKKQNNLPINIIVLESADRLGGVIKSEIVDDIVIEHGADAFLMEKAEIKNLLAELNLTTSLLRPNEKNRQAFVARSNQLIPLPSGFFMIAPTRWFPFITSPLFSLSGKLRIAVEMFLPKRLSNFDESAASFIRRRFGKELLFRAGQPLVGGIYMADVNLLSAETVLTQFVNLEQKFGSVIKGLIYSRLRGANTASGARYNLFGTMIKGTQMLIDTLAQNLNDVQIHLNTRVDSIHRGSEKDWRLETQDKHFDADAIVFALPAALASKTVAGIDASLSKALGTIESSNSTVVNLLYKKSDIARPYKGFGFVVPENEHKQIVAGGFISQKFSGRAQQKYEMIRVFLGGQLNPQLINFSEKQLIEIAKKEIANYLQINNPPVCTWLARWPNGLPFYKVGHKQKVQSIDSYAQKYPGFFFVGSSYRGIGIPDCVRDGENAAASLAHFIEQRNAKCLHETV